MERARPPHDMAPSDFFLDWVPSAVGGDPARSGKLADVDATIQFTLAGPEGGSSIEESCPHPRPC
jgi:hypothetical protein